MLLTILTYVPAVVGLFLLGLAALLTNKSRVNRFFSLLAFSASVWWGLQFVAEVVDNDELSLALVRLGSLFGYIAALMLYLLVRAFLKKKLLTPMVYLLAGGFLFFLLVSPTPALIVAIEKSGSGIAIVPGALYMVQAVFLGAAILMAFVELLARVSKERRNRPATLALLVALAIPSVANLMLGLFFADVPQLQFIGPLSILIMALITFYAMVRHRLFDIKFAAVRSVAYSLSLVTLAAIYYAVAYLASVMFFQGEVNSSFSLSPLNILLALVLAFIFQPIKQFFDKITDAIFYRDRYDSDAFLTQIGTILTGTTNLNSLLRQVGDEIVATLKAQQVTFIVLRDGGAPLVTGSTEHSHFKTADMQILQDLYDMSCIYMRESDGLHPKLDRWLEKHALHIVVPLGESVGWLVLGEPKTGVYAARDIRVLSTISSELIIAIQNARSVQEVKELNAHLQQRIDAATRELRESNEKLRKLDETKDEFVSMASHQLRTPLTSVKGYISMLLEGDGGKITKQQEKLLKEAFMSSERMVRLIGDFLNVSRLQTGKFMIDSQPVDLARVVSDEVKSMRLMAKSHGQELYYDGPKTLPYVMIDEDKTRQVIMNFIDNAIYYSSEGTDIVMKLHSARAQVVFEVHDRGIGVPKEEQDQLFTRFFRADNARKQRPDGTGVGLYLAKKVIEAQGGEIIFHSREGMGSVFGFKLPIKK